jgi:phosphate transport system protein
MEVELFDLPHMADLCKKILHDSLHGFFNNDQDLAKNVLSRDDVIDGLNIRMCNSIKEKIHSRTLSIEIAMELVRICKNLERIADLSTNIAEETCFAVEGKVLKHHAQ